jgi:hypothetical protein
VKVKDELGDKETLEDETPQRSESVKESVSASEASEAMSGGEARSTDKKDMKEEGSKYFVDEDKQHIVRLLISL